MSRLNPAQALVLANRVIANIEENPTNIQEACRKAEKDFMDTPNAIAIPSTKIKQVYWEGGVPKKRTTFVEGKVASSYYYIKLPKELQKIFKVKRLKDLELFTLLGKNQMWKGIKNA